MLTKRKIILGIVLAIVVTALTFVGVLVAADAPKPKGAEGDQAEALADKVLEAVAHDAWEKTGAVRWRLAEGRPLHLWDRTRNFASVTYDSEDPKVVVLLDLATKGGVAFSGETALEGEDLVEWKDKAYSDFANDSFWLSAPAKVRDDGTSRAHVKKFDELPLPNGGGLLVSYASGGVTPGDAYLWELGADGLPTAWRMWVRIIPVGGVRVTWDDWVTLASGAKVARSHEGPLGFKIRLDPLEGTATVADLVGEADPFRRLVKRSPKRPVKRAPATQPAKAPAPAADAGPAAAAVPGVDGGGAP